MRLPVLKEQLPVLKEQLSAPSISPGKVEGEGANSHFLHAGQVYVSQSHESIVVILGSCAAVCIWDPGSAIGGASHYLLPNWDGRGVASPRYGNVAITALLQKLTESGAHKQQLRAKVFGGGCLFGSMRGENAIREHLGKRNIQVALEILAKEHIPVVSAEAGLDKGQRVVFHPNTGASSVTTL
ncbi:MAG TPA: chemotaxis protein CheD [Candidatus Acidoferrum sp.]|nr:chemotaxis protein CheD [Candidatus Acidoferrum sp.]